MAVNFISNRGRQTSEPAQELPLPAQRTFSTQSYTPPVEDDEDSIDLASIFTQIFARKWFVAIWVVLGLFAGLIFGQIKPNQYQGRSLVQVEQRSSGVSVPTELIGELLAGEEAESSLETEFHIIKSRLITDPVVKELNLDLRVVPNLVPAIGEIPRRFPHPLFDRVLPEKYVRGDESISVERFLVSDAMLGRAFSLEVLGPDRFALHGPNGEVAEGASGEVVQIGTDAEIVISGINAPEGRLFTVMREPIRRASARLSRALQVSERRQSEIVDFFVTWNTPGMAQNIVNAVVESYKNQNLSRRSAEIDQSIQFIEQQLPEVQASLQTAANRLAEHRQGTNTEELSLASQALLERAVSLESSLRDLEFREDLLSDRLANDSPELRSIRLGKQRIQSELNDVRTQLGALPEAERELFELTERVRQARELEAQLVARIEQLRIYKASTVANIRILERAENAPLVGPDRIRPIAFGVLGALALVSLWILAGNALRRGIDNAQSVENLGLSLFATIGKINGLRHAKAGTPAYALALSNPTDLVVEALRGLRTGLQFSLSATGSKCIMITSCAPADGKSFIALNLALISAQAGSRVLLIDCDLRRGALRKHFTPDRSQKGLSEFLAGTADFKDIILRDDQTGLEFIGTGRYPPNPSELLSTQRFSELVSMLEAHYDLIILDAPPVLAVTDPGVIGRRAGLSLMVVRHLETTQQEVKAAQKALAVSGVYLSGVVLNQFDQRKSRYGQYGAKYGYYGGYSYSYK